MQLTNISLLYNTFERQQGIESARRYGDNFSIHCSGLLMVAQLGMLWSEVTPKRPLSARSFKNLSLAYLTSYPFFKDFKAYQTMMGTIGESFRLLPIAYMVTGIAFCTLGQPALGGAIIGMETLHFLKQSNYLPREALPVIAFLKIPFTFLSIWKQPFKGFLGLYCRLVDFVMFADIINMFLCSVGHGFKMQTAMSIQPAVDRDLIQKNAIVTNLVYLKDQLTFDPKSVHRLVPGSGVYTFAQKVYAHFMQVRGDWLDVQIKDAVKIAATFDLPVREILHFIEKPLLRTALGEKQMSSPEIKNSFVWKGIFWMVRHTVFQKIEEDFQNLPKEYWIEQLQNLSYPEKNADIQAWIEARKTIYPLKRGYGMNPNLFERKGETLQFTDLGAALFLADIGVFKFNLVNQGD